MGASDEYFLFPDVQFGWQFSHVLVTKREKGNKPYSEPECVGVA